MPVKNSFFQGRRAVLLTKHHKEQVIKPIFEKATGCRVLVDTSFDTDKLGTFTRETDRPGSQLATVRQKAIKGMALNKADLGLASEGSFGPHPAMPFLPWNREIVMLVDNQHNLEIYGECANAETNYAHTTVKNTGAAEKFAREIGFPAHYLVLRPDNQQHQFIIKGINNWQQLVQAVEQGLAKSTSGDIFLETDMRAHANPTRMLNIKRATVALVKKIQQTCPGCGMPGFSVTKKQSGLPCECCGLPTAEIMAEISVCCQCGFSKEQKYAQKQKAPAGSCKYCNP
ncbi:MAG: hypothetical protein LRZ99_07550 [Desulfotomaculum sp.]|nr:hypothetical protein [Desulfotomaculum sp.]